jgi:hypothetical protein
LRKICVYTDFLVPLHAEISQLVITKESV